MFAIHRSFLPAFDLIMKKIRQGKQEKLFHEVIFQIGNREDMAVGTDEGNLAVKVLKRYVKDFQTKSDTSGILLLSAPG